MNLFGVSKVSPKKLFREKLTKYREENLFLNKCCDAGKRKIGGTQKG